MILSVSLKNFRGQKEAAFSFGPGINVISGHNEAGKTTIGHAIPFAVYGADLSGTTRGTDHLIQFGSDRAEVALTTDKAVFHRAKKRGETSKVKVGLAGTPLVEADQTSLTERLGISLEVFTSCFNVGHFMRQDDKKRLEMIGQIAGVDRKALLVSLLPDYVSQVSIPKYVKLVNPRLDEAAVATERRKRNNELSSDQGAYTQVMHTLTEMTHDAGTESPESLQARVEQLRAQQEIHRVYELEVNAYKPAYARAKEEEQKNQQRQTEKIRLELELRALGLEPSMLAGQEVAAELTTISEQISKLAESKKPFPENPKLPEIIDDISCTRCGQVVSEKMRSSILVEREKLINDYNDTCRSIADHNQNVADMMDALEKRKVALGDQLAKFNLAAETWKVKLNSIQTHLNKIEFVEVRIPPQPVKPEGDRRVIQEELQKLVGKQMLIEKIKARYESTHTRKAELEQSIKAKTSEIRFLHAVEEALKKLPEAETKLTLERLRTPGVKFALEDSALMISDVNDVPYACLSTGKQMKVDIRIAEVFQKLLGPKAPGFYFFDNSDLVDDYSEYLPRGQIFIATVDPSATGVTVVQH